MIDTKKIIDEATMIADLQQIRFEIIGKDIYLGGPGLDGINLGAKNNKDLCKELSEALEPVINKWINDAKNKIDNTMNSDQEA